ncbi:MAG: oxidoreductase [Cyclobacteriaceae bacterium]|nr:MAG: oxidoreductase [Cyclobacteriaceae bacterium]
MQKFDRRGFIKTTALSGIGLAMANSSSMAAAIRPTGNITIGIIGLDTSHSVAFSKYINQRENGFEVVAAFTTVSKDIPSSYERVDKFTEEIRTLGIKVVSTIEELLKLCDCILLETNDGRLHLEQAKQVFESGKRVFIDKPVAASIADVKQIYQLSEGTGVPMFSSSGTRYMSKAQLVREGSIGQVLGADTFSPVSYEPNHSDLYWYGIHGVELLFTVMKAGCKRVRRTTTEKYDTVIGEWQNGGIGTFRGILKGEKGYGGQAFGSEGMAELGPWEGYDALVEAILEYFKSGITPVQPVETLEIYAFMEAAKISSQQNGAWIELSSV